MNISQNCLDIIKRWEGYKPDAYLDPVGIPTIGYGTIRYPDGRRVKLGDRISEAQAEAYLKFETDDTVKDLNEILKSVKVSQNEFDALVSLCYNIGIGGFRDSTILKKLKEGDRAAAAAAFLLWNKGTVNGVKKALPGLTNRRKDERALFEKSDAGGAPIVTETSPQDRVDRLEAFRDKNRNVIVAYAGDKVIEILELESSLKEEFISLISQYKNAQTIELAPSGKSIPAGQRVLVASRASGIPAGEAPKMFRKLIMIGMADDEASSDVAALQKRLKELGFYKDDIDGDFGKKTDDAVRAFQAIAFSAAEADGKVGPLTWVKLWGDTKPAAPPAVGTEVPGKNFLKLTKTESKDSAGCFRLKLEYFRNGLVNDSMFVVSGQPKRQFFRKGKDSKRGSYEPLPEGKWSIHDMIWAGARDVYDKKVHKEGIGPVKIPIDYVPKSGTDRDLIQIHIDWNRTTAPGTAGCIGVASVADFKRLAGWLRDTDPRELIVDWGLGSV